MNNSEENRFEELFNSFDNMLRHEQLHLGDVEPAEQTINQDLSEDEYIYVINRYLEKENISFALCAAEQSYKKYPFSRDITTQLCDVYILDNQIEKAEELLNRYLNSFEINSGIAIQMSRINVHKGKLDEAKELYRKAFEMEPYGETLCDSIFALAKDCSSRLYYKEAISLLDKSFSLAKIWHERLGEGMADEELLGYYGEYAYCYEGLKDYDKCIEYLNKMLDVNSFDDTTWYLLAQAYLAKGTSDENLQKAKEALEYSYSLDKQNYGVLTQLGLLNLYLNNFDEALENFKSLNNSQPNDPHTMCALATAYMAKGERKEAEFLYHKALALHPTDENVLANLEELRKALEESEKED